MRETLKVLQTWGRWWNKCELFRLNLYDIIVFSTSVAKLKQNEKFHKKVYQQDVKQSFFLKSPSL